MFTSRLKSSKNSKLYFENNTTYYVRSFLKNNLGDFYGDEVSFTTDEFISGGCGNSTQYASMIYETQEFHLNGFTLYKKILIFKSWIK